MSLREAGGPLLLSLYRAVLRVHRDKLPPPMRLMGDRYLREEFRRHWVASTNDAQWEEFYQQWRRYREMLSGQADLADRSGDIPEDVLDSLSPDQKQQLARLRQEVLRLRGEGEPPDG